MIAANPRLQFELEQLLPGGEAPDAPDTILEAVALRDRGQPASAALLDGFIAAASSRSAPPSAR